MKNQVQNKTLLRLKIISGVLGLSIVATGLARFVVERGFKVSREKAFAFVERGRDETIKAIVPREMHSDARDAELENQQSRETLVSNRREDEFRQFPNAEKIKTKDRLKTEERIDVSVVSINGEKYHVAGTDPHSVSHINDAMVLELKSVEIPPDFGARMEGLFRDKDADEMVRNFAVQHLERFAQERTIRGTWDVDSDEAVAIRAALEDAALEVDSSIGGTAMLALARLSEIDPHVDRRRLSSRSASLVANPSARLSTRIAAAQLCGLLRVRSALPALLSLSADSSVPTPLRLAAAHAAGLVSESR